MRGNKVEATARARTRLRDDNIHLVIRSMSSNYSRSIGNKSNLEVEVCLRSHNSNSEEIFETTKVSKEKENIHQDQVRISVPYNS
jgi:hypothetical protein